MKEYYINQNGKQEGPLTFEELQKIKINSTAMVWHEGLNEWVLATEIPEINEIAKKTPPPLPKQSNPLPVQNIRSVNHDFSKSKRKPLPWLIIIVLAILTMFFIFKYKEQRSFSQNLASFVDVQQEQKARDRQNIRQMVNASVGKFKRIFLGGITDCEIRLTNNSDYTLDFVEVRVDYIRKNGTIWQSSRVVFIDVAPRAILGLHAPNSEMGAEVNCEIVEIKSSELGL